MRAFEILTQGYTATPANLCNLRHLHIFLGFGIQTKRFLIFVSKMGIVVGNLTLTTPQRQLDPSNAAIH